MRRLVFPLAILVALVPLVVSGATSGNAEDRALASLAGGRDADAIATLKKEIAATADAGTRARLQCLLGQAQRLSGDDAGAAATFALVPKDAPCGRKAAFGRADALAALGKTDEAVKLYDELGAPALGPDRDAASADAYLALGRRVLADPDGDRRQGIELERLALGLDVAPERKLAIAREIGAAMLADPTADPDASADVAAALRAALARKDDASDRRMLARLDPADGLAVLAPLPDDGPTLLARADAADAVDRELALVLRARAIAGLTGADADAAVEEEALALAALDRYAAVPWLDRLVKAGGEPAARAAWQEAALHVRAGALDDAIPELERWLATWPSGRDRADVEAALDAAHLDRARRAAARGDWKAAIADDDALVARNPLHPEASDAAYEAGLAARAAGDGDDARRRWDEVLARWPGTEAAAHATDAIAHQMAFDQGHPDAAIDWLRRAAHDGSGEAQAELDRLHEPEVAISADRQDPGGKPVVRVLARNLGEVELRLHRIDAEAFVRAGGTPEALPDLDVAVIAPDARWTVKVPKGKSAADAVFDVPVPARGAGLYAVTVAGGDREAHAILLVSDVSVVARAVGPDLAVAVFRGGRPDAGARVLVAADGSVREERTDRTGLLRTTASTGPLVILAEDGGAPALLSLTRGYGDEPDRGLTTSVDLDRPVYRPGDAVGFRFVARRDGAPVSGAWKVWLDGGGASLPAVRLTADARGAVTGEVVLPPVPTSIEGGSYNQAWSLMAVASADGQPVALATVRVDDEAPAVRSLDARVDDAKGAGTSGGGATIEVREPDGAPAVGVPVAWISSDGGPSGLGRTDATGRVHVDGPPAGLPWDLDASIAGTGTHAYASRAAAVGGELRLVAADDVLRPGEPADVRLRGAAGPTHVTLSRIVEAPAPATPPADPWVPDLAADLTGPKSWDGAGPGDEAPAAEIETWSADVDAEGKLALPALTPGRWLVRAVATDGRASTATASLRVDTDALRLRGARDAVLGDTLALRGDGAASLLTAESDRLLAAAVSGPGEPVSWPVTAAWDGEVTLAATGPAGTVDARDVRVDGALKVDVSATDDGDAWKVVAKVTDGLGRPVVAQVALDALDDVLVADQGPAAALDPRVLVAPVTGSAPTGGVAAALSHGALGEPVAAALLDEQAREEEARRAAAAATGALSSSRASVAFDQEAIISEGSVSGSYSGYGYGAGGYGSASDVGYGTYGTAGARATRSEVQGERARVLWRVGETDRDGVVSVRVPRPRRATSWRLTATALSANAAGWASSTVRTDDRPFLAVTSPGPGAPSDRARAIVTVVNRGGEALAAKLEGAGSPRDVAVPAGQAVVVDLGEQSPGASLDLRLSAGGRALDRAPWTFPLAAGLPSAEGDVATVAIGPGGAPPAAWLALEDDPVAVRDAGRAAIAGRAALAALPSASGADRAALLARAASMRSAIAVLSGRSLAPADAAEVLLFLAEATPVLGVPHGDVDASADELDGQTIAPEDRLLVAWAKARAGKTVDETALDQLLRQPPADDEGSSLLARLLVAVGEEGQAAAFVKGDGPEAALARRELGQPVRAPVGVVPAAGDRGRPDWIAALVASAPTPAAHATGTAEVVVDRAVVGRIDVARGGFVRVATSSTPEVHGAPALVLHGRTSPPGEDAAWGTRVPVGADGRPVAALGLYDESSVRCGSPIEPCSLAPGDVLDALGDRDAPGWAPPGGFEVAFDRDSGQEVLRAVTPGRWTLAGVRAGDDELVGPLTVVVAADPPAPTAISPVYAVALARQEDAAGGPGARWLVPAVDADADLAAPASRIRFDEALRDGAPAADLVARFEDLRVADPGAEVGYDAVVAVARAYAKAGKPERSLHVWRAGLGAAFLDEVAPARQLEDVAGSLASLKAVRDVAARYPDVGVVEEATFHLPEQLGAMADTELPPEVVAQGITATDLRLLAAAWDREFLALHPKSPLVPQAGFHLVEGLLRLQAWDQAAEWADRLATTHPDSPLLDSFLYLEGLARSETGDDARARALFARVATEEFPQEDGTRGPGASRIDAVYAQARLAEARGDLKTAKQGYAQVTGVFPEAATSLDALARVRLEPEQLVRLGAGESAKLPVLASNVDEVHLRAYRIDLRTIFLRDSGLSSVDQIAVAGVSPAWTGTKRLGAGPFPEHLDVDLPLSGDGAWLVQLDGGGLEASSLVVRSKLDLDVDDGAVRRLVVRERGGEPASGVGVRAWAGGEVVATETDLRGVASVPSGASVLVFRGDDYAFTDPYEAPSGTSGYGYGASQPAPAAGDLYEHVEQRLEEQRARNAEQYESTYGKSKRSGVEIEGL